MLDFLFGDRPQRRTPTANRRPSAKLHSFTVQKPYCCPCRDIVMTALNTYGVKVHDYRESLEWVEFNACELPAFHTATFKVSSRQASWAEYLLRRTQRLMITHGSVDGRNEAWAMKWEGKMPKPWIEKSCSDGKDAWRKAMKTAMVKGKR